MAKRSSRTTAASPAFNTQAPSEPTTAASPAVPAAVSGTVLAVAAVHLATHALLPGSVLQETEVPWATRAGLVFYDTALLLGATAALTVVARALPRILGAVGVGVPVFLYVTSWAAFWNTGVFLDRAAFAFWLPHPVQMFHWVYPPLALAVGGVSVFLAVFLGVVVPHLAKRLSTTAQRNVVRVSVGVAVACAAGAAAGLLFGQSGPSFALTRDTRTGPMARLVGEALRAAPAAPAAVAQLPDESVSAIRDGVRVVRRPILPLDRYLAAVPASQGTRWNVLMIQIESLRSDQLRAYGGTRDVMPAIDAVAREGRVFTNAYIQASHSNYADLVPLASQYPLRAPHQYEYPVNPPYPRVLIYDLLKAIGYRTALVSSQNERWGGMLNFHRPESLDLLFHAETFTGPTTAPYGDTGFAEWVRETGAAGSVDDRYTVDEAIRWVRSVPEQTPFFLHMNVQSSHLPYVIPPDFTPRFGPRTLDFAILWGKIPQNRMAEAKARYSDSLHYADQQLQRLMAYLRESGRWQNTLVIIGGDNGEAFNEHGFTAHASSLFNEVIKVPMILRVPGEAPRTDDRPAMFLDIPPTILELLRLPQHPGFQGLSLLAANPRADRSMYSMVQTPLAQQIAIIRNGFKLLFSEVEGEFFLYDQVNDPGELKNVATQRRDLILALVPRLQVWQEEQLAYYADRARQSREYAPVFED